MIVLSWGMLILLSLLMLGGTAEEQYRAVYLSVESTKSILEKLHQLFFYADDWNWITLTTILSFIVIFFNLNDIYLRRVLKKLVPSAKDSEFYYAGTVWLLRLTSNVVISVGQIIAVAYIINISVGTQRIYNMSQLAEKYDAVVLGTSKYLAGTGNRNLYYDQRISATVDLYKAGKIRSILISGDHKGKQYSEPFDMRADLIRRGVPDDIITLDLSGYRTFDSIIKLKSSRSKAPVLFISQQFHLERALFIAKNLGINAIGYPANGNMTVNMLKREAFAKTKVILDIYILNTQAFGLPAHPRRHLSIFKGTDLILLAFVLGIVVVAGRLTRNLLIF